ncbi:helicase [Balnearium lithotrophicum]|uniref:Helicase n=1 Tax=Balnearium lithotrophicum TaxID=223788 RepID=A0A521CGF8_9BACT|nr:DEAD/DEAH box helicase [Balnearium lithotrophicum]SMO57851.1 helicase [Balnearium lithotrophicum]
METIKVLESSKFNGKSGLVEFLINGDFQRSELVNVKEVGLPFEYPLLNPIQTVFYRFYKGGNVLVSSPTSSGKTLISLLFQLKNSSGKFIYTAPTRSLIWEKFKEFKPYFEKVGIRTGDLVEELSEINQPCIVCTYESLISAARNRAHWFEEAGALVIDEVHIIRDSSRGAVVEEIVSYALEEEIPTLALSATIPGAPELSEWIEAELLIESEWRPVPLERRIINFSKFMRRVKLPKSTPEGKVVSFLETLKPKGKTLIFLPSKNLGWGALQVENTTYRREILNETLPFIPKEPKSEEKVAFHNADVPQEEREKIERSFKDGDLNRLYATQTLAYGVNLPADSVVILVRGRFDMFTREYRFFPDPLTVLQMEGRAGRFGLSDKGYSYIVVTGAKEKSLEEALKREMEMPFSTGLSSGIGEREGAACPNRRRSLLSLMVLGPLIRYGKEWKKSLSKMFSIKRNPFLIKEIEEILEELSERGFLEGERPTKLTGILVSSFVSPFCYEEFIKRLSLSSELIEENPTLGYTFSVRPLIRREFNPKTLELFVGEAFRGESLRLSEKVSESTGIDAEDNWEVLSFYSLGELFPFKNIARPPGELSTLPTESSLLGQLLCRLNIVDFERVHRVVMTIRAGIPYEFSLLGSIKGLGYMRGNALARAGKLLNYHSEVPLINGIKERIGEIFDALREALSERYESKNQIEREIKTIVNLIDETKFPLGDEKLLKFLSSIFIGRREAIKISKERALEVLFENVRGKEKAEG